MLLNPSLFKALSENYGNVEVLSAGVSGDYEKVYTSKETHGEQRQYVNYRLKHGGRKGEEYRLSCPFCGDSNGRKRRMHVSYLFGNLDTKTRRRNMFNWICYNEQCQSDINNSRKLLDAVDMYLRFDSGSDKDYCEKVATGPAPTIAEFLKNEQLINKPVPGNMRSLLDIGPDDYFYPAVEYIRDDRRFDLLWLDQYYGVKVIAEPYHDERLVGRIFTPFYRHECRIGWNARAVPNFSENGAEKYVNSSGGLAGVCYGLAKAVEYEAILIVEGVTDKWAAGHGAVGMLGKKLTGVAIGRLAQSLLNSNVKFVGVMLDPQRSPDDIKANRPHHIDVAIASIKHAWNGVVEPILLPDLDPAEFGGQKMAPFIYKLLQGKGYGRAAEVIAGTMCLSTASRE